MGETGTAEIEANGLRFGLLERGPADGPLALCLHGFPDTAWTWRHLMDDLAGAGYRAVAPFMRGYSPTEVPADGRYQTGALVADACALHHALGGGEDAVLIGHDWGAIAAYGAAAHQPERWRRVVTAAVPPMGAVATGFFDYDQLRRSWYMFFFQNPLADMAVGADDLTFVERLWSEWSPGYDAAEDMAHVRRALGDPANLAAALGYYRAQFDPTSHDPALAAEQSATQAPTPQPTLYLHGEDDGCMGADLARRAADFLGPGSEVAVLPGAGHFLHLERPQEVGKLVVEFLQR
ncbi:MAG TPA: alpha/beta hydrolase [Acidimicrobiales bacterium]|nr:alpha/beta hydrolase [Acidimicrobiales bacterium]